MPISENLKDFLVHSGLFRHQQYHAMHVLAYEEVITEQIEVISAFA